MSSYDYIIIGAGSAGCILAERLSASGQYQVLLVEAGGKDNHPWFKIPMGYGKLYYHPKHNWMHYTTPQAELNQRPLYVPRGKVQGGSGSINAMVYVRGAAADFDDWAGASGDPAWSYRAVLPFFKQLEKHWSSDPVYHGQAGNIHITSMRDGMHVASQHFLRACAELGYPENRDFNGAQLEGCGVYDTNIGHGIRDSSSRAYLHPARKRPNLSIMHHTLAEQILFNAQRQAVGVRVRQGSGQSVFTARREVILSAGVVESPKLLELSGIGDAARLQGLGIPLVMHLPQVGEQLQDHLCASFYYKTRIPTLNQAFTSWQGMLKMGWTYLSQRSGPLAQSVNQAGGFLKTAPDLPQPNMQLYFNPLSYTIPKSGRVAIKTDPYPGILMAFAPCRPTSRGSIHAHTPDAGSAPRIAPNYLSTSHDQQEAIAGCRMIRGLAAAGALQEIITEETIPGLATATDEELLAFFRAQSGSIYHLCGTCRMGNNPDDSVVDSTLRVHGVHGLRVVDASVFPNITSGNINAPVMMVAERAAGWIGKATAGEP